MLHVDMDQFIAAVEVLRRPELAGLPVVVGGDGDPTKRAVVSTASYEARAFGVQSGLPLRTAFKRCPQAVFLAVDKVAYEAASAQVMAILKEFDAVVEVIGWDEAFLGAVSDDPPALARRIAARVLEVTGLACSVGIGTNKLQAKTATGFAKPAGVFVITGDTWFDVMGDRATDALWGIGSRTATKLKELGITTVRQLADADDGDLAARFGPATGPWIGSRGRGLDPSPVIGDPYVPRSHSRETTFQQNLEDWDQVRAELVTLTRLLMSDVEADGRAVARVSVKVRWAPFTTRTKARLLPETTRDPQAIQDAALRVLESYPERRAVRLLGVRAEFATTPD